MAFHPPVAPAAWGRFAPDRVGYRLSVSTRAPVHRRAAVLAIAVVVGLLAAACRSEEPVSGTKVLVVGDSLMQTSRDEVTATLERDGWQPDIEALGGTTITLWASRIPSLVATRQPDVVVIELGTNDCFQANPALIGSPIPCPPIGPYIDEIMRGIPHSTPVLWLNTQVNNPIIPKRKYINFEIESAYARWPNLHLVDYDSRIENHPEYHIADGLHLNGAGQQFLADLIRESLAPFRPRGA